MRSYTLLAPAKINLYLEIIGDRPDGFHELVMVLQSIDLTDIIQIDPNGTDQIRIHCNNPDVPTDNTNLAYKAAQLMREQFPKAFANFGGVEIAIDKQIPVAAGLAGGSTNGAAVLVGLNLLWGLGLTHIELGELAAQLGSDVPFCLTGGTAIATGRGEKIDPLLDLEDIWLVLAKYKSLAVSTPWAYQSYRQAFQHTYITDPQNIQQRTDHVESGQLVSAISHHKTKEIGHYLHNDLEKVVLPEYPKVTNLKEIMTQAGGVGTMMSGSGPTVFTLCQSEAEAKQVFDKVRECIPDEDLGIWLTKFTASGIKVI
ncbi:MAG: 4-(cytidine 5'-diphospho)-2-C-methyl-D-erythritol kinase [Microcystaceae cyanobacterium]